MKEENLPNIHPGEILLEEFMKPLGLSQTRLALAIRVPQARISAIVNGKRSITADTAVRLGFFFGNSPEFWLNLQNKYDLVALDVELPRIKREVISLEDQS